MEGTERTQTRARLALVSLVALVVIAFVVDLGFTRAAVPETPSAERSLRAQDLELGLDTRGQLYACLLVLGCGVLILRAMSTGVSFRDTINDVGIAGVAWLLITTGLLILTANDSSNVELPPRPMILAGIALVVAAGIGAFSSVVTNGVETLADGGKGNRVVLVGAAAMLLTIVMAATQQSGPSSCPDPEPWSGPTEWLAWVGFLVAVFCGLLLLVWRRWLVALLYFLVSPIALFFGYLLNACID